MTALPADIADALAATAGAHEAYHRLAPSHRREYLAWIDEAKRPETRARRIAGLVERLGRGPSAKQASPR